MSIASEITDLNTNLQAAKSAVTAKGGTVGDTGLAGLASEIMSIPNGGGSAEPSNGGHITDYNTTTGVIEGDGFGDTAGTVYLLDRDTNTYVAQPTSSWSATSITLTTPIDTSVIEGTTSLSVVDANGKWATKWLITGGIAVTGWGKLYVQDSTTRVVRTIAITTQADFDLLSNNVGNANSYSIATTIGGDTFYQDEIVGIQIGSSATAKSLVSRGSSYHFIPCANNLNQPVVLPSVIDEIPAYFGYYWANFNQPLVMSENVAILPERFMLNAYTFNQPLDLSSVIEVGNQFLEYAYTFNQPIDLSSATTIGNNFLQGYFYSTSYLAMAFNSEIKLDSLETVGEYFLAYCSAFNQPLRLPNTLTSIGVHFMDRCSSFNQPLDLSGTSITTLTDYFMVGCTSFNSEFKMPASLTTIENYVANTWYSFNQPLTLPSTLKTIGNRCLYSCISLNQPLVFPEGLESIGSYLLSYASSLNQKATIPSTVTFFDTGFLNNTYGISEVEINTTAYPTTNAQHTLSTTYNGAKEYVKGVTLTGSGAAAWKSGLPNRTSSPYRKLINGNA